MKNKNKFYLLLLLVAVIFMGKGYCAVPSVSDWGTQKFVDDTIDSTKDIINYENVENIYMYYNASSLQTNTDYFICPMYKDLNYRYYLSSTNYVLQIQQPSGSWTTSFCFRTKVVNYTALNGLNRYNLGASSNGQSYVKKAMSSIDLSYKDNVIVSKNINFTKPSINCPICEECKECPEEGECGPVEITNFPIDKTEFYVLLVMLATLIFMLFFKWCFPMKGGKKQ